jgi:pimeloyl-ACP methyl ester carboxylesterase
VQITGFIADQYGAAEAGVQVQYIDPTNNLHAMSDSNGVFRFSFTVPEFPSSSTAYYSLEMNDPTTNWSATSNGSYSMNTASASGSVPVLYYSQGLGGRGSYIQLASPTLPVVIFVGGGYELDSLHGVSQLDDATTGFLDYLAAAGFNVLAPVGWYVPDVPSFPLVLGALLKHGFLMSQVYLIGWSAGGVASAWALTHDFHRILNMAVIMDAELTGPTETGTHTDISVFTTASISNQVSIPHLLVWGQDDSGTISIQTAAQWFKNAQPGLSRVDPLPYSHTWLGTSAEPLIRQDIVAFFRAGQVGNFATVPINTVQAPVVVQITSNNPVRNVAYNSTVMLLNITTAAQSNPIGTIDIVIPKAALNGEPVVMSGGKILSSSTITDANNYYVFFTYTDDPLDILIGGQSSVPEFSTVPLVQVSMGLVIFAVVIRGKKRAQKVTHASDRNNVFFFSSSSRTSSRLLNVPMSKWRSFVR